MRRSYEVKIVLQKRWYHIAATWQSAPGQTELYVNGVMLGNCELAEETAVSEQGTVKIGQVLKLIFT